MNDNEIKALGKIFKESMNLLGIKNIKDIPMNSNFKEECKIVWVIK